MEAGKSILLVAQKSAAKDEPSPEDLYEIGSIANILQMLKLPDGTVKVLVEGVQRAKVLTVVDEKTHYAAEALPVPADAVETNEVEAMRRAMLTQFDQYVKLNKKIPPEILTSLSGIDEPGRLADTVAAHLPLKLEQKQAVLEMFEVRKRLEHLLSLMEAELDILQVERRIRGRVKRQMEKSQREYYLNEQVKAIQKELGDMEEGADLDEMDKRIKAAHMPKEARTKAEARTQEAAPDVADVSGSDGGAQLHRDAGRAAVEEEKQDQQRSRQGAGNPGRRPLRPGKGQGAHRRVSRGAAARRQAQGADPVPGRPPGRGQDLARPVDRARDQPQILAHVAGRRARRGRDPRPPPHLYRLHAGQVAAEHDRSRRAQSAVPARRSRQDGTGFPRRSGFRAAGGARSRSRTTSSSITTSRSSTIFRT